MATKRYTVVYTGTLSLDVDADNPVAALEQAHVEALTYRATHWRTQSVDGPENSHWVVGRCDGCNCWILEGLTEYVTGEDCTLCDTCADEPACFGPDE